MDARKTAELTRDQTEAAQLEAASTQLTNKRFIHFIGTILAMAGSSAFAMLLTFFAFFGKLVGSLPFLPIIPLVADTLNFIYHLRKILLKDIPLKYRVPIATLITAAYMVATTAFIASITFAFHVTVFAAIVPFAPVLFTGSLGIYAALNLYGLATRANEFRTQPWTRTPLNRWRLANQTVRTASSITLAALIIPFFLAIGGLVVTAALVNPFTAGPAAAIIFSVMVAALTAVVVMKLVKNYAVHRIQEENARTAIEKNVDPYERLGLKIEDLKGLDAKKISARVWTIYHKKADKLEAKLKDPAEKSNYQQYRNTLKELHQAYELLHGTRARDMYNMHKLIQSSQISKPPQVTLDATNPITRSRPILWLKYQWKLHKAKTPEKKNKLDQAYRIMTNSALREFYKEMGGETRRDVRGGSTSTMSRKLSCDSDDGDGRGMPTVNSWRRKKDHS